MGDGLFFDPAPNYPAVWILGLLGFLALWWYIVRHEPSPRWTFIALWVPGALTAALVYRLEERGQAAPDTLRLLLHGDADTLRELLRPPSDGYAGTYGLVIGGTVAALTTMACQLVGVLLGWILAIFDREGRHRRA